MEYIKGSMKLHEILTGCLNVLREDADAEGFGNRMADKVLMENIGGLSLGAARIFRTELVSLALLSTDGQAYIVDVTVSSVTPKMISLMRSARAKSHARRMVQRSVSSTGAQKVTSEDLDRAYHALLAQAGNDGVSPRAALKGGLKSGRSTIQLTLGIAPRRATTLLQHLVAMGRVERLPHSNSVRVLEDKAPAVRSDDSTPRPSLTSVTYEELKAAILRLYGENRRLKERIADLETEVERLRGRVGKLEDTEIDPELRAVLRDIEMDIAV